MLLSNLVRTTRFWNNLHQVRSNPNYFRAKQFYNLWEQENHSQRTVGSINGRDNRSINTLLYITSSLNIQHKDNEQRILRMLE